MYHLTSLDSFEKILTSFGESDEQNLIFWASRVYEVNDPNEMLFGIPIITEAINEYEKWNSIDKRYKLSMFQEDVRKKENIENFNEVAYIKYIAKYQCDPFIISFCKINEKNKIKNELPLWTTYGDSGKGICLVFDENLFKLSNDFFFKYSTNDIIYLNDEFSKKGDTIGTLRSHFQNEYREYLKRVCKIGNTDNIFVEKRRVIASMSALIGAFTKSSDYEFESEYRIAAFPKSKDYLYKRVKYRLTDMKTLIPYTEIPIPVDSLQKIIVGPCVSDITLHNLKDQIQTLGLNIVLTRTELPFRNL